MSEPEVELSQHTAFGRGAVGWSPSMAVASCTATRELRGGRSRISSLSGFCCAMMSVRASGSRFLATIFGERVALRGSWTTDRTVAVTVAGQSQSSSRRGSQRPGGKPVGRASRRRAFYGVFFLCLRPWAVKSSPQSISAESLARLFSKRLEVTDERRESSHQSRGRLPVGSLLDLRTHFESWMPMRDVATPPPRTAVPNDLIWQRLFHVFFGRG